MLAFQVKEDVIEMYHVSPRASDKAMQKVVRNAVISLDNFDAKIDEQCYVVECHSEC